MKAIHKAKQRSNQHKRKYSKKGNSFRFSKFQKQGFKSVKGGYRLWVGEFRWASMSVGIAMRNSI